MGKTELQIKKTIQNVCNNEETRSQVLENVIKLTLTLRLNLFLKYL